MNRPIESPRGGPTDDWSLRPVVKGVDLLYFSTPRTDFDWDGTRNDWTPPGRLSRSPGRPRPSSAPVRKTWDQSPHSYSVVVCTHGRESPTYAYPSTPDLTSPPTDTHSRGPQSSPPSRAVGPYTHKHRSVHKCPHGDRGHGSPGSLGDRAHRLSGRTALLVP